MQVFEQKNRFLHHFDADCGDFWTENSKFLLFGLHMSEKITIFALAKKKIYLRYEFC